MNGENHPLVWAYEVGALDGLLSLYIGYCIKAITADYDVVAEMNLKWADGMEDKLSPELIQVGRVVVELILGINSEQEQDFAIRGWGQK